MHLLSRAAVTVTAAVLNARHGPSHRRQRGQATTEYVLVLLGVAAIALVVVAWATRTGKITALLDRVFDQITSQMP